jgi:hypothetical protein
VSIERYWTWEDVNKLEDTIARLTVEIEGHKRHIQTLLTKCGDWRQQYDALQADRDAALALLREGAVMTLMNQTGMICAACGAQTDLVVSVCPSCKDWARHLVQLRDELTREQDVSLTMTRERDKAHADLDAALALLRGIRHDMAGWKVQTWPQASVRILNEIDALLSRTGERV